MTRSQTDWPVGEWIDAPAQRQHLLFCPTNPSTLMYCHEGPWDRVEQRLWLMHWDGSRVRPLRYQETPDLAIGHEYWLSDGRHVDYVRRCKGQPTAKCCIDTLSGIETVLTLHGFCHFISDRTGNRIVGDDADDKGRNDVCMLDTDATLASMMRAKRTAKNCHPLALSTDVKEETE